MRATPIQMRVIPVGLNEEDLDERVIRVKIVEKDIAKDDNIVGRWQPEKRLITLVGPKLKENSLKAKIVAMHELGSCVRSSPRSEST